MTPLEFKGPNLGFEFPILMMRGRCVSPIPDIIEGGQPLLAAYVLPTHKIDPVNYGGGTSSAIRDNPTGGRSAEAGRPYLRN